MPLTTIFMGTPPFAVPTLRALAAAGHRIAAVYTQPPRAAGRRGLKLMPSQVALAADELGLFVHAPVTLKDEREIERLAALDADVAVVVAYGLLLPRAALDSPRLGCLNGHGSLLPRWRGAAPIQRAIEAGDAETGVMVMRMETGLDTGPVARTARTPIGPSDTAGDIAARLSHLCAETMVAALAAIEDGTIEFEDQASIGARENRETTYARKIDKAEAEIDWRLSAMTVARRINAFSPSPGAFTSIDFGAGPERVRLLRAVFETAPREKCPAGTLLDGRLLVACAEGAVRILELQRAGGRAATAADFLRSTPLKSGATIGGS